MNVPLDRGMQGFQEIPQASTAGTMIEDGFAPKEGTRPEEDIRSRGRFAMEKEPTVTIVN